MSRAFIIILIFVLTGLFFLYTPEKLSVESEQPTMNAIPVFEQEPENKHKPTNNPYNYIAFKSDTILDIEPILQMPKYPTGCELISLTMALEYVAKTDVDTETLIDNYITLYSDNFMTGFKGDPRTSNGGGCFPPAIVECANRFLEDNHINQKAGNQTGITKDLIMRHIDAGFPVLMWTTMYMGTPKFQSATAEYEGQTYNWYTSEHCVLVIGYDSKKNVFIINDPLEGQVERDIDKFMEISDTIGNLAVIIK